ncbi:MAG: PIN domain nuclease [Deltaproteobacteria bacterium]|nr:PIN domain nuclease [Deltaproteobacteria bacterium]
MILIDSSSWIHFLNQSDLITAEIISELLQADQVVTCGPVITEVLSGAERNTEYKVLKEHFSVLPFLSLEKEDFFEAALLRGYLRKKGVEAKTVDSLIAQLSMRTKMPLFHHDSDFNHIARHTDLKIQKGSLGSPL